MNVNENALIQVQDLKKSFGTQVVLDGITTEIDQGEVAVSYTHLDVYKRQVCNHPQSYFEVHEENY